MNDEIRQEIMNALRDADFRAQVKRMISEIENPATREEAENAQYGLISSDDVRLLSNRLSAAVEYPLPWRFLPDLDFGARAYWRVIDEQPISDFRKAVYWHVAKSTSIVQWFLGRRNDAPVPRLVPEGQGQGRARYGFQVADLPDDELHISGAVLAVGVTNEQQAMEWLRRRADVLQAQNDGRR